MFAHDNDVTLVVMPEAKSQTPKSQTPKGALVHKTNLIDILMLHPKLSGHFASNDEDKSWVVNGIPMTTVPMCAPFQPPFTSHFLTSLHEAVDYIKSTDTGGRKHEPVDIIIPIKSPGGTITELKEIRTAIQSYKREKIPGTNIRRFNFVTYGLGMVASCAFILFMEGDTRISVEEAQYLCHEPRTMQTLPNGGTVVQAGSEALKTGCELEIDRKLLYEYAELALFGGDNGKKTDWWQRHKQDLEVMHREMTGKCENKLCEWDVEDTQLFDFITRVVGDNTENMFITSEWMLRLELIDRKVPDICMCTTETYHFIH